MKIEKWLNPEPKQFAKQKSQFPSILDLPNEILEIIFLKVASQHDIHQNIALVCKRFQKIVQKPKFYHFARFDFITSDENPKISFEEISMYHFIKSVPIRNFTFIPFNSRLSRIFTYPI